MISESEAHGRFQWITRPRQEVGGGEGHWGWISINRRLMEAEITRVAGRG